MNFLGVRSESLAFYFFIGVASFIFLSLVLREFRNWYWKHNEIIELLQKIERNTRRDGALEVETLKLDPVVASRPQNSAPSQEVAAAPIKIDWQPVKAFLLSRRSVSVLFVIGCLLTAWLIFSNSISGQMLMRNHFRSF